MAARVDRGRRIGGPALRRTRIAARGGADPAPWRPPGAEREFDHPRGGSRDPRHRAEPARVPARLARHRPRYGSGLYDAAFATLGGLFGRDARAAITSVTLWGGFASTVCWPLSAWMVDHVGWRGACGVYALIQIAISLPLHAILVPGAAHGAGSGAARASLAGDATMPETPHQYSDAGARKSFRLRSACRAADHRLDRRLDAVDAPAHAATVAGHGPRGRGRRRGAARPLAGGRQARRDDVRPALSRHLDHGRIGRAGDGWRRVWPPDGRGRRWRCAFSVRATASAPSHAARCRSLCSGRSTMRGSWDGSRCRACWPRPCPRSWPRCCSTTGWQCPCSISSRGAQP